ncbi:cytidine deaminase [Synergistales bacterium]|nr:cytidine deaminase [Synergistales bacterium]
MRPSWDAYFLAMAMMASMRSTCLRRRVGAVVTSGNRVLATGYNGSPSRTRHCEETGCRRQLLGIPSGERHEICRGSHAEMNAIAQAASCGTAIYGSVLYSTHEPCSMCAKLIINAGCSRTVYMHPYPDDLSVTLMREAGLISEQYGDIDQIIKIFDSAKGETL